MNKEDSKYKDLFSNINIKKKTTPVVPSKEEVIDHNKINGKDESEKRFERKMKSLSPRTIPLTTKLSPDDYELLNYIAYENRWKLVEVLENSIRLMAQKIKEESRKR